MWLTLLFALSLAARERIPVVLSTDVGNEIDDQWALVYLLTQPRFDVKGLLSAHAPTLMWADFLAHLDAYQSTHAIPNNKERGDQ